MSLSLTSGSFGDAITTIQLVYRLTKALSASSGSARELQDLVAELRLYQNVLQQVRFVASRVLSKTHSFATVDYLLGKQETMP